MKRAPKKPQAWSCAYTLRWRDREGAEQSVTAEKATSPGRAMAEALALAKLAGYTRPRWWDIRRWREVDYERLVAQVGSGFPA